MKKEWEQVTAHIKRLKQPEIKAVEVVKENKPVKNKKSKKLKKV